MIIIIDAYNVLKQALSKSQVSSSEKSRFIKQIDAYGHHKGHKIIIVFDGGSFDRSDKETIRNTVIVHSGIHQSADDWIKEYLDAHKNKDILLISTDRELNRYAAKFNIQSLDALDFYYLLQEAAHTSKAGILHKQRTVKISNSTAELDTLMEEECKRIPTKSEDIIKNDRSSNAHTLSKKERLLQRKLRKL